MANTIKCPGCGAEMSADSRKCPVCGRRRFTGKDKAELLLLIVLIFFGCLFISSMRAMAKRMDEGVMENASITYIAELPPQENEWIIS